MPGLPYAIKCEITFDGVSVGSPTWVDITAYLIGFTTFHGTQRNTDGPQPGTLEVRLDNTDGRFDPDNTAGPYFGSLMPNRRIRISAQQTSVSASVPIFYAYVDRIQRSWPGGSAYSETVMNCTDLSKLYARRTVNGLSVATGSTSNHMNAVAGYSATVGGVGLIFGAHSYDGPQWDYITDLAIADGGFFFIDGLGNPVYHASTYRTSMTVSTTVQSTYGFGAPNYTAVDSDLLPYLDDSLIANSIRVRDFRGTQHPSTNGASVTAFGVQLLEIDGWLDGLSANIRAAALRDERSFPTTRVDAITLDALTDDTSLSDALTRNISDRIRLVIGPLGGGSTTRQDYWINSVAHDVQLSGDQQWKTTWQIAAVRNTLVAVP